MSEWSTNSIIFCFQGHPQAGCLAENLLTASDGRKYFIEEEELDSKPRDYKGAKRGKGKGDQEIGLEDQLYDENDKKVAPFI